MIINTKEISSRIKLGSMLFTLVYVALLVASLVFKWSPKYIYEYVSSAIFVLVVVYIFIRNYNYIYYNSDGLKYILRYTPLRPLSAGNFSVEIPKRDFVKGEIKSSYFGLRPELVLYVRTPQGVAKFNPISISVMNKTQIDLIKDDLSIK